MLTLWVGDAYTMSKKTEKVKKVIAGEAHVRIGKNGVTEQVVEEIKRRLKKEGVIKVRVLRSLIKAGASIEEIASEVASKARAEVVDIRGHVFVLVKRKHKE